MNIACRVLFIIIVLSSAPAWAETRLKIGTLPIYDTLLLHVAQREGFFQQHGLDVELVPFQSFVEKNAAVQSGELDGHFGEISAVIIQRAAGLPFVIVSTTSHTSTGARMFGLVTSPKMAGAELGDLKGKALATSNLAIVDFLADVFFERDGLPGDFMDRKNLAKIPVRMQMLTSGQVDAAVLPEPLLSIAEKAGGRVLRDDRDLHMPLAVVALREDKLTEETVRAFNAALTLAGRRINAEPDQSRALLLELRLIPPQLAETFALPPFDLALLPDSLPSPALYERYVRWLVKNKALAEKAAPGGPPPAPPYRDVVWSSAGGRGEDLSASGQAGPPRYRDGFDCVLPLPQPEGP